MIRFFGAGNVFSIGLNTGGCLGLESVEVGAIVTKFTQITTFGPSSGRKIVDISCGSNYSAAITDKGRSLL